jgi:type IV pilus assembly protein PilM
MKSFKEVIDKMKHGPTDVVGIDVGTTAVKVARLRKGNNGAVTLLAADVLPKIEIPEQTPEAPAEVPALQIPPKLKGRYGSIVVSGQSAVIKLLSFPGAFDAAAEGKVVGSIGLDDPNNYRIGYKLITEGHGKSESRVLAVALPETEAKNMIMLFPTGLPAPFSLEVSGLATMSAFLHSVGKQISENAVGVIDFGAKITSFALFNKGLLALIRRFNFGVNTLLDNVQQALGVDRETAQGIVSDGSFDISQSVNEVIEPIVKQLIVSRDFVERRENCHISKIYVSGGMTVSRDSLDEIKSSMGLEVALWTPLEGLTVSEGAIPGNMAGQESRFSAAIGAALATFEET